MSANKTVKATICIFTRPESKQWTIGAIVTEEFGESDSIKDCVDQLRFGKNLADQLAVVEIYDDATFKTKLHATGLNRRYPDCPQFWNSYIPDSSEVAVCGGLIQVALSGNLHI